MSGFADRLHTTTTARRNPKFYGRERLFTPETPPTAKRAAFLALAP
ncbi:hypothetical protein HNP00_000127 [Arthrobacter sp. AZCC_0090]|nr:hypothetical protein [Arthrobacter sp. AZCC_0090]